MTQIVFVGFLVPVFSRLVGQLFLKKFQSYMSKRFDVGEEV